MDIPIDEPQRHLNLQPAYRSRGDNESSNPITIFEFKKPQRHDFANHSSDNDSVQQIIRYVNQFLQDGKFRTPKGRDILFYANTTSYGDVVCDLPRNASNWLHSEKLFTVMPDGLGYFQWPSNIRLYMKVLN